MMVSLRSLIVGTAAGNHDDVTVRIGYRLEEPQWIAVLRGDALHLNGVPGVEGIRSDFADSPLRECRGGAECKHPLRGRVIRILNRDSQRPVGIYKLHFFDRPRELL